MGIFGSIFSGAGLWVALPMIAAAMLLLTWLFAEARRDKTIRRYLWLILLPGPLILLAGVIGTFEYRDGIPLLVILIIGAFVGLYLWLRNSSTKHEQLDDSSNT